MSFLRVRFFCGPAFPPRYVPTMDSAQNPVRILGSRSGCCQTGTINAVWRARMAARY